MWKHLSSSKYKGGEIKRGAEGFATSVCAQSVRKEGHLCIRLRVLGDRAPGLGRVYNIQEII